MDRFPKLQQIKDQYSNFNDPNTESIENLKVLLLEKIEYLNSVCDGSLDCTSGITESQLVGEYQNIVKMIGRGSDY